MPELLDYQQGMEVIDWETMNLRDYHDPECKSICMAECLAPGPVSASKFFKIYAHDEDVANAIRELIDDQGLDLEVVVNEGMFL